MSAKFKTIIFILVLVLSAVIYASCGGSPDGKNSTTNVQVEGVDEGDIVKVDANGLIYKLQTDGVTVSCIDKDNNGALTLLKKEPLGDYVPLELYATGNMLITIGGKEITGGFTDYYGKNAEYAKTEIRFYRVSDLTDGGGYETAPFRTTAFTGQYFTSRIYFDRLYVLTTQSSYGGFNGGGGGGFSNPNAVSVKYVDSVKGNVEVNRKASIAQSNANQGFTIAKLDLAVPESADFDTAVFNGDIKDLYFSENAIYPILKTEKRESSDYEGGCLYGPYSSYYTVTKYSVAKVRLEDLTLHQNVIECDNEILGRYYLHDSGENLFITEHNRSRGTTISSYDNNMARLDKLTVAPGESLHGIKYLDGYCYFVTFKQVDPLFKIDISNPRDLKEDGQLTIPGFSTYLQKFGTDRLIGVGFGEADPGQQRIKVSLFNIAADSKLAEITALMMDPGYSVAEATDNPKAILIAPNKNLLAFSAKRYEYKSSKKVLEEGAYIFQIDEGGELVYKTCLSDFTGEYTESTENFGKEITRVIYFDKYICTISDKYITSYDMTQCETDGKYVQCGRLDTSIGNLATKYKVTFMSDGQPYAYQDIAYNGYAFKPTDPEKDGFEFIDWYADEEFEELFDFTATKIKKNTFVYAKFEESGE